MADFFRGLQGGFQTGMQLGQAMRQRRMEEDLAKAYGLTPQEQQAAVATPEQLQRAQAEAQALQQQDIAEFGLTPENQGLYAPRMPQEGQRVALPTYTLGSQTFQQAPTQEQIDAARLRAAADVYGQYGDAARREELMRGLRAEERAAKAETRAQAGFETQQQLGQLQIGAAQAQATERANTDLARKELSERKAANKGTLTLQDFNEISGKYNLDPTKFVQADEVLESKQVKDTKRALSTAALKGEAGINDFLATRFDPDKSDNIVPKLARDRAGNIVVMYGDQVLSEYGAHKNVMSLVGGVINMIDEKPFETLKTLSDLEYKAAATEASKAAAAKDIAVGGYYGQGLRAANLIDVQKPDGTVTRVDQSKYMKDGELQLPQGYKLIKAEQTVAQMPPAMKVRYDELVKSDRWERARTVDDKIALLEKEGIPASVAGLRSPTDDLIALMKQNQRAPAQPQQATPAGKQLVGLAGALLPPPPVPPTPVTTSAQRMRGLYLGQ